MAKPKLRVSFAGQPAPIKTSCMIRILIGWVLFIQGLPLAAQSTIYSVANAHSHNDYENPIPFHTAYAAGFGSIEADIFLVNSELIVAHDTKEILQHRTLQEYYLIPLAAEAQKVHGFIYPDSTKKLQMLIDIKTDATLTLKKLIAVLDTFPLLAHNPSIRWTITGNRPDPSQYNTYPGYIYFDGEMDKDYTKEELGKISMMSSDFKLYSQWDGKKEITEIDETRLKAAVSRAHQQQKPVRFWDAPDFKNSWYELMLLQVDYINTDHIAELAEFLSEK
jgi:alkaline phosphatase